MEDPSDHLEHESHVSKFIMQEDVDCVQNFDEKIKRHDTMFFKQSLRH